MRVLVVTSTFPRWHGDDTTLFVLHFTQALIAHGLDVDVLAPHAPGAATREELDGVHVERFRYFVPSSGEDVCYTGGALFNLRGSPARAAKLPGLVGAELAGVARRARRYDVVSAHWLLPQGWAAVRASGRTPVVTTIHGSDVFGLRHPVLARFKRTALRGSAAVTVNSSATRDAVETIAPDLPDLRLIPMGIDVAALPDPTRVATWRAGATEDGPLVAYVGRLVDWKGVDDLVRAIAVLHRTLPGVRVVVAGTGPMLGALQDMCRELAVDELVRFVGWIDRQEVAALQSAADVVVVPSRTAADGSREGQGLAVVEALALGRPVVASQVGGIPDAIEDGVNGLLVPEQDPAAIAGAISRLWADQDLGPRIGRAAAQSATRYAWPRIAAGFAELFEDVVRRPGRR